MELLLFILCVFSFFSGMLATTTADTIFQQIIGCMSFVISSILLIGVAIVNALDKIYKELIKLEKQNIEKDMVKLESYKQPYDVAINVDGTDGDVIRAVRQCIDQEDRVIGQCPGAIAVVGGCVGDGVDGDRSYWSGIIYGTCQLWAGCIGI